MGDDKTIFDGSDQDSGGNKQQDVMRIPILENDGLDAAAWLKKSQKGKVYVSVQLPLNLGSLTLFAKDDMVQSVLNDMFQHIKEQREDAANKD